MKITSRTLVQYKASLVLKTNHCQRQQCLRAKTTPNHFREALPSWNSTHIPPTLSTLPNRWAASSTDRSRLHKLRTERSVAQTWFPPMLKHTPTMPTPRISARRETFSSQDRQRTRTATQISLHWGSLRWLPSPSRGRIQGLSTVIHPTQALLAWGFQF